MRKFIIRTKLLPNVYYRIGYRYLFTKDTLHCNLVSDLFFTLVTAILTLISNRWLIIFLILCLLNIYSIAHHDMQSEIVTNRFGVPQGSNLGLLLFLMYT